MRIRDFFNQECRAAQIDRIAHLIMRRIRPAVQLLDDLIAALFGRLGKVDVVSVFSQLSRRNAPAPEGHPRDRYRPHVGDIPLKQLGIHQRRGDCRIIPVKKQIIVHLHADEVMRMFCFKRLIGGNVRHKADFFFPIGFRAPCISSGSHQSVDAFGDFFPAEFHVQTVVFPKPYALCVVPFFAVRRARYAGHPSARSVFMLEKFHLLFFIVRLRKERPDSLAAARKIRSAGQNPFDFILRDKTPDFRQFSFALGHFPLLQCQIPKPWQNRIGHEKPCPYQFRLTHNRVRECLNLPDQFMQFVRLFHLFKESIHAVREHNRFCRLYQRQIVMLFGKTVTVYLNELAGNLPLDKSCGFHVFQLCSELSGFDQRPDALRRVCPRNDAGCVGIPRAAPAREANPIFRIPR